MHWLNYIWISYFWSSDKGNGPEAIQQTLLAVVAAAILIPVVRKAIKRESAHLHAKLDHLIKHHPDIPSFTHPDYPTVESVTQPTVAASDTMGAK